MALGKNVKLVREGLGLQATELAELSGIGKGTISALENRDSAHSRFTLQLSQALGLQMEDLMLIDLEKDQAAFAEIMARAKPVKNARSIAHEDSEDGVVFDQYDAAGAVLDGQAGVIRRLVVAHEWLRLNVHGYTSERNLCLVTGFGPSMLPRIKSGDPLLLDRGVTNVKTEGVYFFRIGELGYIKQLQPIPVAGETILRAKSYNPEYESFDITKDMDFAVFGRILKVWKSEDF